MRKRLKEMDENNNKISKLITKESAPIDVKKKELKRSPEYEKFIKEANENIYRYKLNSLKAYHNSKNYFIE